MIDLLTIKFVNFWILNITVDYQNDSELYFVTNSTCLQSIFTCHKILEASVFVLLTNVGTFTLLLQFIHGVSFALGIDYLSNGHMSTIVKVLHERSLASNAKLHRLEMLAILLLKASGNTWSPRN